MARGYEATLECGHKEHLTPGEFQRWLYDVTETATARCQECGGVQRRILTETMKERTR